MTNWEPPTVVQFLSSGTRKPKLIGDAPSLGHVNLISQYARDRLIDIWERYATLYPIILDDMDDMDDMDEPFYMVVPKLYLDCLDKTKSDIKVRGDNSPYLVTQWTINEEVIGDVPLFSIDIGDIHIKNNFGGYYVTAYFKQRVIDAGLEGFCFHNFFGDPHPFVSKRSKNRPKQALKSAQEDNLVDFSKILIDASECITSHQIDAYLKLCGELTEKCLKNKEFDLIEGFYQKTLEKVVDRGLMKKLLALDYGEFLLGLEKALDSALVKMSKDKSIKAIYCEYFYDGGDASDVNLFLCTSYDKNSDDWACDFITDQVIFVASVLPYFKVFSHKGLSGELEEILTFYITTQLFIKSIQLIERKGSVDCPFGFAQHEHAISIYPL